MAHFSPRDLGEASLATVCAVVAIAVNRHREDALRTFRSFVEGTESPDTKDQVLLAAARAAFGQVPTGLVTDKGDGASVLEVLSGIGSNLTRRWRPAAC